MKDIEKIYCTRCGGLCGDKALFCSLTAPHGQEGKLPKELLAEGKDNTIEFWLCETCAKQRLREMKSVQEVELDLDAIAKMEDPDKIPEYRTYKYLNDIE